MILNVWTVLALFLAALGAGLGVVTAAVALRGLLGAGRGPDGGGAMEDRVHLVGLLMGVLTGLRLAAWPHFYVLMKSYVPEMAPFGVMCVFGVTRVQPGLVSLLQALKPALLLGLGLWWVLFLAVRRTRTRALIPGCLLLAVPLAGLALLECAAEAAYILSEKVGQPVTCCTQFIDTSANRVPTEISGIPLAADAPGAATAAYYLASAVVIAGALFLRARRGPAGESRRGGVLLPLFLIAPAAAALILAHRAWVGVIAPRVLQLPHHHCLYEVLTDAPALGLAAAMTVAANGCLLWPPALALVKRRAPEAISGLQGQIYGLSALLQSSALLIVTVHCI